MSSREFQNGRELSDPSTPTNSIQVAFVAGRLITEFQFFAIQGFLGHQPSWCRSLEVLDEVAALGRRLVAADGRDDMGNKLKDIRDHWSELITSEWYVEDVIVPALEWYEDRGGTAEEIRSDLAGHVSLPVFDLIDTLSGALGRHRPQHKLALRIGKAVEEARCPPDVWRHLKPDQLALETSVAKIAGGGFETGKLPPPANWRLAVTTLWMEFGQVITSLPALAPLLGADAETEVNSIQTTFFLATGDFLDPILDQADWPTVDDMNHRIEWQGALCIFSDGSSEFKFIKLLIAKRKIPVSHSEIIAYCGLGSTATDVDVHSLKRRVVKKLLGAGLTALADAITPRGQHYSLVLPMTASEPLLRDGKTEGNIE